MIPTLLWFDLNENNVSVWCSWHRTAYAAVYSNIVIILYFLLFYWWFPLFWSFVMRIKRQKQTNMQIGSNINSICTVSWILWNSRGPPHDDFIICKLDEYIYTLHKPLVMPNIFIIDNRSLSLTPFKPQAFEILMSKSSIFFKKKPGAWLIGALVPLKSINVVSVGCYRVCCLSVPLPHTSQRASMHTRKMICDASRTPETQ